MHVSARPFLITWMGMVSSSLFCLGQFVCSQGKALCVTLGLCTGHECSGQPLHNWDVVVAGGLCSRMLFLFSISEFEYFKFTWGYIYQLESRQQGEHEVPRHGQAETNAAHDRRACLNIREG